jgi:cobalamin biosynthesis protein CobD/CbiB
MACSLSHLVVAPPMASEEEPLQMRKAVVESLAGSISDGIFA